MVLKTENFDADPLSQPLPGMSLTDTPGQRPYERPALISSPEEAIERMEEVIKEPSSYKIIINLLEAGISSETVASALILKMFSEGVFTPDVAEIIKPFLIAFITELADEAGIEDINVVNQIPKEPVNHQQTLQLMQKLNPDKFNRQKRRHDTQENIDAMLSKIDFPEDSGQQQEEEQPSRQSFLDMEVA